MKVQRDVGAVVGSDDEENSKYRNRLAALIGREIGASLFSREIERVLPTVDIWVSNTRKRALVDSGCSKSVAHTGLLTSWIKQKRNLETLGEFQYVCEGHGLCEFKLTGGSRASVDVLVCDKKPLGFDMILGMDAIQILGGVWVGDCANV